jgi:hypothetical protein
MQTLRLVYCKCQPDDMNIEFSHLLEGNPAFSGPGKELDGVKYLGVTHMNILSRSSTQENDMIDTGLDKGSGQIGTNRT